MKKDDGWGYKGAARWQKVGIGEIYRGEKYGKAEWYFYPPFPSRIYGPFRKFKEAKNFAKKWTHSPTLKAAKEEAEKYGQLD